MTRQRRKVRRWVVLGGVASLALVPIVVGVLGLRVKQTITAAVTEASIGRDDLLAGAHILKTSGAGLTKAEAPVAEADFKNAELHFGNAHRLLTQGRLVGVARSLPWVGTQIRAAADLSDAGVHVSRSGALLTTVLTDALAQESPGKKPGSMGPGERLLETLQALDPKLSQLSNDLDRVLADRARIPSTGLLPQLQSAVTQFDQKVDLRSVRDGLAAIRADEPAIRELLGASGVRTYLVLQQDPAELRATGGFIGSVGFLSFDHGKMAPFVPSDVYRIDTDLKGNSVLGPLGTPTHVDAPFPLQHVFHLTSWELRDSNWSPDFPTAARQAEDLLTRETGRRVDGVIAIDPYFIQRLLSVIGPTTVPETGDVVDEHNFFATTLNRVELNHTASRKNFLSQAANAIFARVLTIQPGRWLSLLPVMSSACEARSLQASFHDGSVQGIVDRADCGGEVASLAGDGLLIVDSNVGGNKDDFWLQRTFALQIKMSPDGSAQHSLNLHYSGLSAHGFLTQYWGYTGWLRIYLPSTSEVTSVHGAKLSVASDLGRRVLEGWVYVQFDHTLDVSVVYNVNAASMSPDGGNQLRFEWQKQAGRLADPISVDLTLPTGWSLHSATVGSLPARDGPVSTDLSVGRVFRFEYQRG